MDGDLWLCEEGLFKELVEAGKTRQDPHTAGGFFLRGTGEGLAG